MQKPYKHYKLPTIDKINVIKITIICTCTYVHINTEDHYIHEHRSFPYQRILIVYQIKVKIRNNFIPPPIKMVLYLNILANLIINSYFNNSKCIVHYHDNSDNLVHFNDVVTYHLTEEQDMGIEYDEYCSHFLIQHENTTFALEEIEHFIKMNENYTYSDRKYIIILHTEEDLNILFESNLFIFIRDVLIILASFADDDDEIFGPFTIYDTTFDLFTHKYVGESDQNDIILLDAWFSTNLSFKLGNSLFPDKISNQLGRELRAPCYYHTPYAVCEEGK